METDSCGVPIDTSLLAFYIQHTNIHNNDTDININVKYSYNNIITAKCTLVQSTILRSHIVRLSVRLSMTLVDCDHIGGKSWKLIAQTISPTHSLFVFKRQSTYSQGNMGKFGGD